MYLLKDAIPFVMCHLLQMQVNLGFTFFYVMSAGAYKLCQTLIFHPEVLYATISLHTFLHKIKNNLAYFQKYSAVRRRAMAYYLNIMIK